MTSAISRSACCHDHRNCGGSVPVPGASPRPTRALLDAAQGLLATVRGQIDGQAFHRALEAIWQVIGDANRYVDEQAPWALRKTDPARMRHGALCAGRDVRHLAILVQPFMPGAAASSWISSPCRAEARAFAALDRERRSPPGTRLPAPRGRLPALRREARPVKAEGEPRDARRQPLPSRFPGFRHRARCGGRARPRRRRRRPCSPSARGSTSSTGCGRSPRPTTMSGARSASIRTRRRTTPSSTADELVELARASQGRRHRRDRARFLLRAQPAREPGGGLPRPYRGGAADRPAADRP